MIKWLTSDLKQLHIREPSSCQLQLGRKHSPLRVSGCVSHRKGVHLSSQPASQQVKTVYAVAAHICHVDALEKISFSIKGCTCQFVVPNSANHVRVADCVDDGGVLRYTRLNE